MRKSRQKMKNSIWGFFRVGGINDGERLAAKHLKKLGYRIVSQNYKAKMGEIDIIAMDGDILVFAEVKQRASDDFGAPREFVTKEKQRKIKNTAQLYMMKNKYAGNVRFDVVEVLEKEITHIKNAF